MPASDGCRKAVGPRRRTPDVARCRRAERVTRSERDLPFGAACPTIPEERTGAEASGFESRRRGRKESAAMAVTTSAPDRPGTPDHDGDLRAQQVRQAEELLFSGPATSGFAKALFRGEFRGEALFPYPELAEGERSTVEEAVAAVRAFA